MLKGDAGLVLLVVATLRVMRAGDKMGSGPNTSMLLGVVFAVGVLIAACVPVTSHVS